MQLFRGVSAEKNQMEEKRFAILPKDSIRTYAEAGGHTEISDDVAALLAEDVVYRLREATQVGGFPCLPSAVKP